MTHGPLSRLGSLVSGVALLRGPLAHQTLAQLLVSGSRSVEVAGASVALAAVQKSNVAVQLAVGTLVPAAVVDVLNRKEEQRLALEREKLETLAATLTLPLLPARSVLSSALPTAVAEVLAKKDAAAAEALLRPLQDELAGLAQALTALSQQVSELREQLDQHAQPSVVPSIPPVTAPLVPAESPSVTATAREPTAAEEGQSASSKASISKKGKKPGSPK